MFVFSQCRGADPGQRACGAFRRRCRAFDRPMPAHVDRARAAGPNRSAFSIARPPRDLPSLPLAQPPSSRSTPHIEGCVRIGHGRELGTVARSAAMASPSTGGAWRGRAAQVASDRNPGGFMSSRLSRIGTSLVVLLAAIAGSAGAQIPPHTPGTVCVANNNSLWCWAISPGAVGAPCTCSTPYGPVAGTLR
jgi:hypothetical protein